MSANFDREYRLAAGKAGGMGFEIGEKSKSQPVPLHINFSIERTDLETQNTGRVTVWNLNKEHLAALDEKDCVLSLKAGYGSRMPLIFAGIVTNCVTTRDGADRKTEIEVVDNLVEIRDTYVTISYVGTVNWKTIFDDVANQMGVAVTYSYNAEFADIANGFSFVGLARDIMTKGCACCGLVWSLQNGVMQVKKPGEVEFFLNGAIHIDDYVKLESKTVTGYFRVAKLTQAGDNISGDWTCTARLMEVQG